MFLRQTETQDLNVNLQDRMLMRNFLCHEPLLHIGKDRTGGKIQGKRSSAGYMEIIALFKDLSIFCASRWGLKTGKNILMLFFRICFSWNGRMWSIKALCSFWEKYFLRFLPSNSSVSPLVKGDLEIVSSILRFGSTVGIVPVKFDAGDRVIITDGPFKDFSGNVIAVNRRNKRLNIQIDFMNGVRVVGLCYEEVQKQPAK